MTSVHLANHTTVVHHGARIDIEPALTRRNRLTCAFRPILAIPHVMLVGAPVAFGLTIGWSATEGPTLNWGAGGGVLGIAVGIVAMITWVAILFTGRAPEGLTDLAGYYLRWRVRAMAYVTLLRDEYPPFGDGDYPARVAIDVPAGERSRLSVAFRLVTLIPHFVVVWLLSVLWLFTTVLSWVAILFTGNYPTPLYEYAVAVFRWSVRVEAYLLLLHDEYPPFSLE